MAPAKNPLRGVRDAVVPFAAAGAGGGPGALLCHGLGDLGATRLHRGARRVGRAEVLEEGRIMLGVPNVWAPLYG